MSNGKLHPGDAVPEDACTQVGNFPHGLLTNPDALELDEGAFGPAIPLASKKQDYVDAFDANDLTVCNEGDFAKQNSPYIVFLEKKDEEEPPVSDAHSRWLFVATIWAQSFRESEMCRSAFCGACLYLSKGIANPCGAMFTWTSDIGSCSFSAKSHQYMQDVTGDPAQCPPVSATFGCKCFCSPACDGQIEIESYWNPETMNLAYLQANGIDPWTIEVAKVRLTSFGPYGSLVKEQTIRASGVGYGGGQLSTSGSWNCYDDGTPWNYTMQSNIAHISFSAAQNQRWQHNWARTERPQCTLPPPGASWPPIIDDPSHGTY